MFLRLAWSNSSPSRGTWLNTCSMGLVRHLRLLICLPRGACPSGGATGSNAADASANPTKVRGGHAPPTTAQRRWRGALLQVGLCFVVLFCRFVIKYGQSVILGVQSYRGNGNLLTALKCCFAETVSQECLRKTAAKNSKQNGFHGAHIKIFFC